MEELDYFRIRENRAYEKAPFNFREENSVRLEFLIYRQSRLNVLLAKLTQTFFPPTRSPLSGFLIAYVETLQMMQGNGMQQSPDGLSLDAGGYQQQLYLQQEHSMQPISVR